MIDRYHADMNGQVFVSFDHHHDIAYVARLAGQLAAAGIAAKYDPQHMSESWWENFTQAQVAAADAVLVVMTPEAEQSGWVAREIEYAQRLGKPIVPLLLRGDVFAALSALDTADAATSGAELAARLRALNPTVAPADPEPTRAAQGMAGWGSVLVPVERAALAAALGIETQGGMFTPIIERGKGVPCLREETFTTAEDNQPSIRVKVFHSNSRRIDEAVRVGEFEVRLVDQASSRGVPAIRIAFRIDERGMFRLSARDDRDREQPILSR